MFPPLMAGLHHASKKNEGDGEGNHHDDVKHLVSEESGIGRTEDFESIFGEATDAEAGRHARAVMWSVHRRLQRDDAMLLGYRTFARFLGYVVLFILVVYFQLQSLRSENRVQYGAVRSAVFGLDLNVTTDGSVDVSSHLASYAVLSDWVGESVIPGVWTLPSCGDAECTEELPGFDAGEGTRATFFQPQCPADCGVVETARVSVSFFDVGKLAHAFAMVEDVAGAAPVAGWNVCHASDREAGTPELVCVFDGDAFIGGRPYRTAELDPRDARFGGTKNLTLYGGDWELRYAFAGFDAGGADATGFPAIRGEVCVADPDDNATTCERWDPCPAAAECVCEYVDETYRCFGDDHWAGFDARSMTHADDQGDPFLAAFPRSLGLGAVADWWRVPRAPVDDVGVFRGGVWGDRGPPAGYAVAHVEDWDARAFPHVIVLLSSHSSRKWESTILEIRDAAGRVVWTSADVGAADWCQSYVAMLPRGEPLEVALSRSDGGAGAVDAWVSWELWVGGLGSRSYSALLARGAGGAGACAVSEADVCEAPAADGDVALARCTATTDGTCPDAATACNPCSNEGGTTCNDCQIDRGDVFPVEDVYACEATASAPPSAAAPAAPPPARRRAEARLAEGFAAPPPARRGASRGTSGAPPGAAASAASRRLADGFASAVRCDFDEDLCGWEATEPPDHEGQTAKGAWYRYVGPTATTQTGPKEADDASDAADPYAYIHPGNPAPYTAFLTSPAFEPADGGEELAFAYHAYGDRIGSLDVEALVGGTWVSTWRVEHDQGGSWHDAAAPVPAGATRVRFVGFTNSALGDIAVDAVRAAGETGGVAPGGGGGMRCYGGWKMAVPGGASPGAATVDPWLRDAGDREVVECDAGETHCVSFEYIWPWRGGFYGAADVPAVASAQPYFEGAVGAFKVTPAAADGGMPALHYVGRGGCWSGFAEAFKVLIQPYETHPNLWPDGNASAPQPDAVPGPLSPRTCGVLKMSTLPTFTQLSECFACEGDLCNARGAGDPAWYENAFGVSAHALLDSMDFIYEDEREVEGETISMIFKPVRRRSATALACGAPRAADGACDLDRHTLGCGYDYDCCGSDYAACEMPWYLLDAAAAAAAAGDAAPAKAAAASWRYAALGTYATVPFALYEAVRDRLFVEWAAASAEPDALLLQGNLDGAAGSPLADLDEATLRRGFDAVAGGLVPSLACPECASYDGPYRAVPFAVNVTASNRASPDADKDETYMFADVHPDEGEPRRFLSPPNLVLYGLLVTQRRSDVMTCRREGPYAKKRHPVYSPEPDPKTCSTKDGKHNGKSRASFGVDVCFVAGTPEYRDWYVASDYYGPEDLDEEGVPKAFSYDMGESGVEDFAVLIPTTANQSRALDLWKRLGYGNYLDHGTDKAKISFMTVNLETGLMTLVEIEASMDREGGVALADSVTLVNPTPYDWDSPFTVFRLLLEALFLAYLAGLIVVEAWECLDVYRRTGSVAGYFFDVFNILDLIGYGTVLTNVKQHVDYVFACAAFAPEMAYATSADPEAVVASLRAGPRLAEAGPGLAEAQRQFARVKNLATMKSDFVTLVCYTLIIMSFQLIKTLDFHPRVGIISRTLIRSRWDLLYFILIFSLLLFLYAFIGFFLHSDNDENFENIPTAAIMLLKMTAGLYDDESERSVQNVLYYWIWMIISFFLMLNFLLAIIVDNYNGVADVATEDKREPLFFTLRVARRRCAARLRRLRGGPPRPGDGVVPVGALARVVGAFLEGTECTDEVDEAFSLIFAARDDFDAMRLKTERRDAARLPASTTRLPASTTDMQTELKRLEDCCVAGATVASARSGGIYGYLDRAVSEDGRWLAFDQSLLECVVRVCERDALASDSRTQHAAPPRAVSRDSLWSSQSGRRLGTRSSLGRPSLWTRPTGPARKLELRRLAAVVAYNVLERYGTGADLSGDGVCTKKEESAILRLIRLSEAFPDGQGAAGDRIGLVAAWHYFTGDSDALPDKALELLARCATTGVGVPETATAAELGLVSALVPRLVPRPPSSRELDGLADEDGGADDGEA